MKLKAERTLMNYSVQYGRLEKKYNQLLSQKNEADRQELLNISNQMYLLKDSVEMAREDVKFWKEMSENRTTDEGVNKSSGNAKNNDNIVITERVMPCPGCSGTGRCFMCHGRGTLPFSHGDLCYCLGLGLCNSCHGEGKVKITNTFDKTTGYYCTITSDGFATNGFVGSGSSSGGGSGSSYPSLNSNYEDNYRSLERHAESIYNSITREINDRGDRKSDASGWGYTSSYSGMAREYVRAQSDMKRVRADALKEKIIISPSIWETKTIRY